MYDPKLNVNFAIPRVLPESFKELAARLNRLTPSRGPIEVSVEVRTATLRGVVASADDRDYHGEQHRKLLFFIVYPSDRHTPCCHTMLTNRCGANVHWLTESNGLYDTLSNTSGVELGIIALGAHDPSPADLENVLGSWR